jgi:hypothetical protein
VTSSSSRVPIVERLDALEHEVQRIDALEHEGHRIRDRLTALEQDRQMLRELAETTRDLGRHAKELAEGIEAIAERAVEKVLERRSEKRLTSWKFRLGYAAALCSCIGVLADHRHQLGL